MDAASTWVSILPNLSIGVIAVVSLVYVVLQFLKALDNRAQHHEKAMDEREKALRQVEFHVRTILADALTQSTVALEQNSKVLTRVMRHLDGDK